jgi:hypothetical protein
VLPYCSSQGPHDQYFFREPKAMFHGKVRPPLLDLANQDLVESHLSAVWLSCTEVPLNPSIAELLLLTDPERPLKQDLVRSLSEPRVVAADDQSTASHQQVPNPRFFLRVQGSRRSCHLRRSERKDGPSLGESCSFSVPEEGHFANADIAATLLPVP